MGLDVGAGFPDAVDLLAQMRAGRLSAEALMAQSLARIEAVNPQVNAIVALRDRDVLMAEARAVDQAGAGGALSGLPIAIKDLAATAGIVSTSGSPVFADHVPKVDEIAVARIRAAGAILIGKTNVPEFGLGSNTFNPVYGATRNPYDPALSCGGSSGGAAVALATGMLALADGSDMMGSLRNPAAWNNVYGLRPGWGVVPSEPLGEMFLGQLSTLGPMARSPQDLGLLLDVMAGPDPRQPHGVPQAAVSPVGSADLRGKRIGWLGDWGGALPMEPGILPRCEEALAVMRELGAEVEIVSAPFDAEAIWEAWICLRSWQLSGSLAPLLQQHRGALKDTAIWEVERGLALSGSEIMRASKIRSDWFRKAHALFQEYDALVLPSVQVWPFDPALEYPREIAGVQMDTYHRWMQVTVPPGLLGLPALAMPAGFSSAGLPTGIQIFGPRGGEAALLGIAGAYHGATNWPAQRPAML